MSLRSGRRSISRQGRGAQGDDDDDDDLSIMASPGQMYAKPSRGRSEKMSADGERSASRSRSRSSSVLRRIIGGNRKDKSKDADDGMSVASGMTSVASTETNKSKIKRVKKIKRTSERRSRSSDGPRQRTIPEDDGSDTAVLDKKLRKKTKLKYKTRRVSGASGVDSDGDYGAADSDGDVGSVGGRSVSSEGILSPRKIRRKRRPKRASVDDEATLGSSKTSFTEINDYPRSPRSSSKGRGFHGTKIAAIPEPPMSPQGKVIKNTLDNLFPLPGSASPEKKKLPRVKRKSKPEISEISFDADEPTFSPIVDRTPGARPSDYRKSKGLEAATPPARSGLSKFLPPLPISAAEKHDTIPRLVGDSDTVLSMTDTMSTLHKQLDEHREENKQLQKQLTDALSKVASLNEELRHKEGSVSKTKAHLAGARAELEKVRNEKDDLMETVTVMKQDLISKDDHADKLQNVVETQLDTIEFLEAKLEQTEDELFKMEDELKVLDDGSLLDQSVHAKSLIQRRGSIQQDAISRRGSIRLQTEESRVLLKGGSPRITASEKANTGKRLRPVSSGEDLDERETKIVAREKKLDDWEKELVKVDMHLKQVGHRSGDEASTIAKLQLMEKRERRMEENRDALLQEKEELLEKVCKMEIEMKKYDVSTNFDVSLGERATVALKQKIVELESEKECLVKEIAALKEGKAELAANLKAVENDKQDLLVKLDHVRATSVKDEEEHRLEIDALKNQLGLKSSVGAKEPNSGTCNNSQRLLELREDVAQKDAKISSLEHKLREAVATPRTEDDDGKDLLIQELQKQLVGAKKEAQGLSSGDYISRLKQEVKTLKEGHNELKKKMKKVENDANAKIRQKESSIKLMQKDAAKLKRDLERLEKRDKNLGSNSGEMDESLKKHIEDLENEIDHWKCINADLENELEALKVEFVELKKVGKSENGDDDENSIGSLQSMTSYMSEQQGMEMSCHSITANDMFFVSDSNSVRSQRTIGGSVLAPPPPSLGAEPSTPSQRALRSVSTLWSKMRTEPNNVGHSNPAIPYGAGILDDD